MDDKPWAKEHAQVAVDMALLYLKREAGQLYAHLIEELIDAKIKRAKFDD